MLCSQSCRVRHGHLPHEGAAVLHRRPLLRGRPFGQTQPYSRQPRRLDSLRSKQKRSHCSARESDNKGEPDDGDEPEATVLLVACGIGLATGAGVVLFNDAILWIRHLAFLQAPVQSVAWGVWARQLSLQSSLLVTALPPTVGGLTVGLLRYLSGGFNDQPPASDASQQPQRLGLSVNGVSLSQNIQRQQSAEELSIEQSQQNRVQSGRAINTSAPGGRDFALDSREEAQDPIAFDRSASDAARDEQPEASTSSLDSGQSGRPGLRRQLRAGFAPVLRAIAAAITLGSGCSLGPEGPSVEIGRSTARALGRVLRSKQRRLLPLLAAGSGAGVAAGFNAPISGVFFAVESVLQRGPRDSDMEARNSSGLTVAMVLLASVVAAIVSQAGLGDSPAFRVPPYQLQSLWELPLVLLLGSTCGLVSVGFSYCSEVSNQAFHRLNPRGAADPLVWVMLPALGGLCTGIVALAFPEILYQGYSNVNALLELRTDDYAPGLLLQMLAAKVLATAVCSSSGLVGGIYAPSIFMGAALGSAFGGIAQATFAPTGLAVAAPAAYALVGVAGMLAANCQVPLTAVLLLFELTHDYFIIVPTLAAVGLSYWTASLPIAAGISARLQASAEADGGAGSLTSVDRDRPHPAQPFVRQISVRAVSEADRSNGVRATDRQQRIGLKVANGGQPLLAENTTAAVVEAVQELTAECAVDAVCVTVTLDTPLAEALLLLDSVDQSVALVLDEDHMVTGVLTKDRIQAALEAEAECRVALAGIDGRDSAGCTVELAVGAGKVDAS